MQSLRNTDPAAFASYMAAKYPAAPKTVAEDAIEGADAYLNNAVLPTYTELLAAVREAHARLQLAIEQDRYKLLDVLARDRIATLINQHDRTMRGEFGKAPT